MEALIIKDVRDALSCIRNPRFYETERGFQGELNAELRSRLLEFELNGALVEQEYQKRIKEHGFRTRPDMIIHVPFEGSEFQNRSEGNFVVIELKHRSSRNGARDDYQNLSRMCHELRYPLAIFINIDSDDTFVDECAALTHGVIHAFAVRLSNGEVEMTEQTRT